MAQRYVIVGNGVAGVTAARTLAAADSGADIQLISAEPYPYYSRPRLWEYLAGTIGLEDLYFYPPEWYERRGIRVHLGQRVVRLDLAGRKVLLADGTAVPYDRLLLATGARSFVPPIAGAEKEGVFTLRTIADAQAMRAWAEAGARRAIAIGGGLLGLETARALRLLGLEVTVVEMFPYLLPRQLDPQGAAVLATLIREMGLSIVTGATTEAILGQDRATGIRLKDGREIPGELILISAGVRSEVTLAKEAGLAVNRGTVVDAYLRTSAEGVYAAGDAAEFQGVVYGIIPAAVEQARVAGAHMAGQQVEPYQGTVPSNTLKIVGLDLTSVGVVSPEGEGYQELRWQDEGGRRYKKFVLRDGRLVGAILLGDKADAAALSQLIAHGVDVSAHVQHLLEEGFNFKALL
ncbi:MAG: NAD(P)/FAD-dependent oxidoreductase [Anaerolineae bacterium]